MIKVGAAKCKARSWPAHSAKRAEFSRSLTGCTSAARNFIKSLQRAWKGRNEDEWARTRRRTRTLTSPLPVLGVPDIKRERTWN